MATKVKNKLVLTATGGPEEDGVQYSDIMDLGKAVSGSFQISWTGSTPVATETVWASNKPNAGRDTDVDWIDVTATFTAVNVTGASGSGFVEIAQADHNYQKYKLKFDTASGTANVDVFAASVGETN